MFGWEFPPFIAGGLGTACYGLTRALDRQGHEVIFVLPKPVDASTSSHVILKSPASVGEIFRQGDRPSLARAVRRGTRAADPSARGELRRVEGGEVGGASADEEGLERTEFRTLASPITSPYPGFGGSMPDDRLRERVEALVERARGGDKSASAELGSMGIEIDGLGEVDEREVTEILAQLGGGGDGHYGTDLVGDAQRYAALAAVLARHERFDVIHAHDWLTYPAGIAARAVSGKPLVVHVHATEFDRSGSHVNQSVYEIERAGMHAADRVIAVSMLTRSICEKRYGVAGEKIEVVYNGVEQDERQPEAGARIASQDKIVLFLGRITMQKGPEYFIRAARRVLEKIEDVKFVVAGSGDMALRMIEEAAALGIGHKVLFTGFLRGKDVARVFQMADCYVMPSVSEPFGIAPLEAMSHETPVIISKQSGVAEVLTHALKVDFWDIDEMANKIVAVLKHPPLSNTLKEHGTFELRRLTWDGAAERCGQIYRGAIGSLGS